jgi:hypothetical protein
MSIKKSKGVMIKSLKNIKNLFIENIFDEDFQFFE